MGSLANYAENALIGHIVGSAYTPVSTLYLALSTQDPLDDGSGQNEPGDTYARQSIGFNGASTRKVVQAADVTYSEATVSWGTITHWSIMDAASGGNMLAHGTFSSPFEVVAGNKVTIGAGEVEVSIIASSGAGFVDYLVHSLLDLMFNNIAFAQPDTYVVLATSTVSDGSASVNEIVGTGYSRVLINKAGQSTPAWVAVSSGATENADAISWSVDTLSIVNENFQWTLSASGTNEYYLEATGGDPGIPTPGKIIENGTDMVNGTVGSLATAEWAWADNDTLGFSTVYVRLSDEADPATKADGYLQSADDWAQIVAMALVDAASSGTVLAYDNDSIVDQTPTSGDTVKFSAGALDVSLS